MAISTAQAILNLNRNPRNSVPAFMMDDVRPGAISLEGIIDNIAVPPLEAPELNVVSRPVKKNLFEFKQRAWHKAIDSEARCDFAPNKIKLSFRYPQFAIISLWMRSKLGKSLSEIKSDESMIEFFASNIAQLIPKIIGSSLSAGDWAIVTPPKRRHIQHNFASLVAADISGRLSIPFHEDIALCHSKHRVNAIFSLADSAPPESNIIIFDDIVTTGATMLSMFNLLNPLGKNLVFFTGINNKA